MIVYPVWTTSRRSHQVVGIWHDAGLPWQPGLPVQSGQSFSRLRGCPQGSRTSTSSDALPRSGPLREPITQWDSAQNGYFDVPGIIGNTFQRRVLLKCIEWERKGSIQFQFHSWSLLQLFFRRAPYTICSDPPICQSANCCYFVFFMMCKSKRQHCVFTSCSLRQTSLCNLLLFSPYFFSSFCSLRSCIAVSSSLAVGASRVPHQRCGQAHFSQVASSAKKQKTKNQKTWGFVIDSRRNRVPALEWRYSGRARVCLCCLCLLSADGRVWICVPLHHFCLSTQSVLRSS